MTLTESTALLSKGASLKLLTDMLKQAEEEKRALLAALKDVMVNAELDVINEDVAIVAINRVVFVSAHKAIKQAEESN